eukprot:scaffold171707_cov19-Tisochrysis_lutea.AAC.2
MLLQPRPRLKTTVAPTAARQSLILLTYLPHIAMTPHSKPKPLPRRLRPLGRLDVECFSATGPAPAGDFTLFPCRWHDERLEVQLEVPQRENNGEISVKEAADGRGSWRPRRSASRFMGCVNLVAGLCFAVFGLDTPQLSKHQYLTYVCIACSKVSFCVEWCTAFVQMEHSACSDVALLLESYSRARKVIKDQVGARKKQGHWSRGNAMNKGASRNI